METLGIYIQIPFCASKCTFCNFSSRVDPHFAFDAYLSALQRETAELPRYYSAQGIGPQVLGLPVDTIYVGGGTPTLLGTERLGRLLDALRERFRLEARIEFTVECTPGSADRALLADLRRLGVNRLSIGAQAFNDHELRTVGRLYSGSETEAMIDEARDTGFGNISLDLIAGLPYQTEESWRHSLHATARLRPEHVSLYILEVDEKSRLGREVLSQGARYHAAAVPDEAFMAEAYEAGRQFLARERYAQYEISNFARPGYESRHNRKYWRLEPYVGLGAGAHSFDGARRWANETEVDLYQRANAAGCPPFSGVQMISRQQRLEEYFFLGLRQKEGVDLEVAKQLGSGDLPPRWVKSIADFTREGWLERAGTYLRLTERAYLVSNEIFQEFVRA